MAKRFTLAEARSMLPFVGGLIREAVKLKTEYEESDAILEQFSGQVMMMGGMVVDRGRIVDAKAAKERSAGKLKEAIEAIHESGCQVKDLDIGLVDFPSTFRGEEVCLCWKLGEPDIEYWHSTTEGFAGRKKIDQEFRDLHYGDRTQ
jgi:hypothetical protein